MTGRIRWLSSLTVGLDKCVTVVGTAGIATLLTIRQFGAAR